MFTTALTVPKFVVVVVVDAAVVVVVVHFDNIHPRSSRFLTATTT